MKYSKRRKSKRKYNRRRNPREAGCITALKALLKLVTTDPTRYDSINPYSRPQVKMAMRYLAKRKGWNEKKDKHAWMDVKLNPRRRKSRNSFGIGGHHETRPSIAFDVFLNGKNIDTVFYSASSNVDADEVRRSLINHDGYDSGIVVRKARRRKKK
jgi:hypothetical protein